MNGPQKEMKVVGKSAGRDPVTGEPNVTCHEIEPGFFEFRDSVGYALRQKMQQFEPYSGPIKLIVHDDFGL